MAKKTTRATDIVIIGGGPAGLSLARALAPSGLAITIVESSSEAQLAKPKPDGRDIALTHLSRSLMQSLDMWDELPEEEINPIREARVLNGTSPYFLQFNQPAAPEAALGFLVPNNLIRAAAYKSLKGYKNVTLLCGHKVKDVQANAKEAIVKLDDERTLTCQLAVAADSRFSETRRMMGIKTQLHDFGRAVIVCRMKHKKPHHGIAYECFIDEQTLAILPLYNQSSSVVVTLPGEEARSLMALPAAAFNAYISERAGGKLGEMTLVSDRSLYPLVATYASRFHANRFALVGDAAVGMHPVTAHGFNFGLRGAVDLATRITAAYNAGEDIAREEVLGAYTRAHRRVTRPLYLGTNLLVDLYTRQTPTAQLLRRGLLHLGNALPPVKKLLMNRLTELPASAQVLG